jgi:hypothetical protein
MWRQVQIAIVIINGKRIELTTQQEVRKPDSLVRPKTRAPDIKRIEDRSRRTPKPRPPGNPQLVPTERVNKLNSGKTSQQEVKNDAHPPTISGSSSKRKESLNMASPRAVSRVQGARLWERQGLNPFKYGWPHKRPSNEQLRRMNQLIASKTREEQEDRWQELKSKFWREGVPLAPHVRIQLLWIGADPEAMRTYAMDLLDHGWQSTHVYEPEDEPTRRAAPVNPGHYEVGSTSQVRTGFQHPAMTSTGGELSPATRMRLRSQAGLEQATQAGDPIRAKLEQILADPNRDESEKWQKMIKAAASELEPTKGVNETELTEMTELAQKWNPASGRHGAEAGRQALIEQLAQITAVLARTNLGKAAEFARALGNLCNGQPITTGLKRFEPCSAPRENEETRSRGTRFVPRGRGYSQPPHRQPSDQKSGGGSGRSKVSQRHSSSSAASKDGSIERNRPPSIKIPEGRLLTSEENPREKRARLNRPIHERLEPLPRGNNPPDPSAAPTPHSGAANAVSPPYNLRNRVASPGESNETITTPSS